MLLLYGLRHGPHYIGRAARDQLCRNPALHRTRPKPPPQYSPARLCKSLVPRLPALRESTTSAARCHVPLGVTRWDLGHRSRRDHRERPPAVSGIGPGSCFAAGPTTRPALSDRRPATWNSSTAHRRRPATHSGFVKSALMIGIDDAAPDGVRGGTSGGRLAGRRAGRRRCSTIVDTRLSHAFGHNDPISGAPDS